MVIKIQQKNFETASKQEEAIEVRYESIKVPSELKEQDPTQFLLENFELAAGSLLEQMYQESGRDEVVECELEAQKSLEALSLKEFNALEYASILRNFNEKHPTPSFSSIITKAIIMNKFMNQASMQDVKLDPEFLLLSNIDLCVEISTVNQNNIRSLANPKSLFNRPVMTHTTAVMAGSSELYRANIEDGDDTIEEKQSVEQVIAILGALYSGNSALAAVAGDTAVMLSAVDKHFARRLELQKIIPGIRSEAFASLRLNMILDYISLVSRMSDETIKTKLPNVDPDELKELATAFQEHTKDILPSPRIQTNHSSLKNDLFGKADLEIVAVPRGSKEPRSLILVEVKTYTASQPGSPMQFRGHFRNTAGGLEAVGPEVVPAIPDSNLKEVLVSGMPVLSVRVPRSWVHDEGNSLKFVDKKVLLPDGSALDISMLDVEDALTTLSRNNAKATEHQIVEVLTTILHNRKLDFQ